MSNYAPLRNFAFVDRASSSKTVVVHANVTNALQMVSKLFRGGYNTENGENFVQEGSAGDLGWVQQ